MGKLWDECAVINSIAESAVASEILRRNGIPFNSVYLMPPKTIIVSARSQPNLSSKISHALWGSGCRTAGEYIVLVGDDVDPTNIEDVWWCMTTRLHASRGISIFANADIDPLIPMWSPEERRTRLGARACLNPTFEPGWDKAYLKAHTQVIDSRAWPPKLMKKVMKDWKKYGYAASAQF